MSFVKHAHAQGSLPDDTAFPQKEPSFALSMIIEYSPKY